VLDNISETRKDRQIKLAWRAYRNSSTLFRTVPSPTSYGPRPPIPQDLGFATPPKTPIAIISGTGKTTDFKFGRYIHRVKSPLKCLEKRECERAWGVPNFCVPPIILGTGKATYSKFCTHIHRIDRNKSALKISGKVAVGVVRDSIEIVMASIYRAHRAIIFALAQLSC